MFSQIKTSLKPRLKNKNTCGFSFLVQMKSVFWTFKTCYLYVHFLLVLGVWAFGVLAPGDTTLSRTIGSGPNLT